MKIRNIIFDLGGVILDIDYQLTSMAFRDSGLENFDELYSQAKQTSLFDDLETGKISAAEFRKGLKNFVPLPDEQIDFCWNAMLKTIPDGRIDFLNKLSSRYRLFLLSNTNEIHIGFYRKYLLEVTGRNYLPAFEKEYYSHEIGLRKPDLETFEFVCQTNNLEPSETLFVDDTERHIKGASEAGLQVQLITNGIRIEELSL